MRRDPVGPQHATEGRDHRPAGRGAPECRGSALGPRPADVGVVQQRAPGHRRRRPGSLPADERPPDAVACAPRAVTRPQHRCDAAGPVPSAPPEGRRRPRRPAPRPAPGDPGRAGGSTAPPSPVRSRHRAVPRAVHRARAGTRARGRGPWGRSAAGPRPPATPCSRAAPCTAGWAAGRGAPGALVPAAGPAGGPPPGRRSSRTGQRWQGHGRCGTPRDRGAAHERGQAVGAEPGTVAGSGRCRRKVPVARLTSTPSAARTVASP